MVRQRVDSISVEQRPFGRELLALSFRGLLVVVVIAVTSGIAYVLSALGTGHLRIPWLLIDLWSLLSMSLLAYIMVPAGLRTLARPQIKRIDHAVVRLGRKCALAAVVASTSLMTLEQIFTKGVVYGDHEVALAIKALGSLIVASPYAPLYVALSLLAERGQGEVPEEHGILTPEEA
jgi:hypothetical protein